MSVKVHEPVCLDSAQDLYFWYDHFLGDQLKDEWRTAGAGSAVVVDAQPGGIVRITTGAITNNEYFIDWRDIRSLLVSKKLTFETRLKLTQTNTMRAIINLRFGGADNLGFDYNTPETSWHVQCDSGGTTDVDTNVLADTDYHIFRIECFPTGEVHFYIDGVETDNSPIVANITAQYLQPWIYLQTKENVAKSMDVDYCVVRQER